MSVQAAPRPSMLRARWAAIGAVVAVCLGAGSIGVVDAIQSTGERSTYTAIPACRVADTRPNPEYNTGPKNTPLGAGQTMTVKVTGANGDCSGIPNDITGISLNVTVLHATHDTHLTIWPDGPVPDASSLNPAPGQPPVPNAVTTKVAGDGTFKVFNFQGSVNVIIDIVGYHQDHNHDDRYLTENEVDQALESKPSRTRTLMLSPAAFRGYDSTYHVIGESVVGLVDGVGGVTAPLDLPVGSTLQEVTYHYQDNASSYLLFDLTATSPDGSANSSYVDTFLTSGKESGRRSERIELDYVVPSDRAHYFTVGSSDWNEPGGRLWLYGIEVKYRLPS